MKGMTKEEQERIDELYQPTRFLDRFHKTDARKAEIIRSFANTGSMLTISFLLPFALEKNKTIQRTARETIHEIILRNRKQDVIGFDQYMRRLTAYHYEARLGAWHHLSPDTVRALAIVDEADVSFLGICSFHRNGYVREAAAEVLSKQFSGGELPFLFLRLNDWLPKIRFTAYKALKQRIRPECAQYFLNAIYFCKHLSEYYNREKFTDLVDEIYQLLRDPANQRVLLRGFRSEDLVVRRFSFSFAIDLPDIDLNTVVVEAYRQSDALIRLQILKHLYKTSSNECLILWLKQFRYDVFPPIRQLTLQAYIDRNLEESSEELHAALLDSNKTIREMARYYLKDKQVDFPLFYREKLNGQDERVLQAAIAGLAETGDKADVQWITPFLHHDNARICKTAVKALGMLNPEKYRDVFIRFLQADKPSVSREARQILAHIVDLRHADLLWAIFQKEARLHVKKNILFLFTKLGRADSILYLLQACSAQEEQISEFAKRYVESWTTGYNTKFYVQLNGEKRQRLNEILETAKDFLPENTVRELEFLAGTN